MEQKQTHKYVLLIKIGYLAGLKANSAFFYLVQVQDAIQCFADDWY